MITVRPFEALGFFSVAARTGTYNGVSGNAPLFSFRWGDATRLCVVQRVIVTVVTTVGATAAGQTQRQLNIARNFTASDSTGTVYTPTANNQKRRTSFGGASLVTDIRANGPLNAGTRVLDANPIAEAAAVMSAATTGFAIPPTDLLNATNGQEYPVVLARNEGIIVSFGNDAQPGGATNETFVTVAWAEVAAY